MVGEGRSCRSPSAASEAFGQVHRFSELWHCKAWTLETASGIKSETSMTRGELRGPAVNAIFKNGPILYVKIPPQAGISATTQAEGGTSQMDIGQIKDITQIVSYVAAGGALLVGVITLLKSVLEYKRQGATKRAEQILEMRERLRGKARFVDICDLLENDDKKLQNIPLIERDNFIGFYEELYLLWNSRVFNDEVVYYLFGYFAMRCWESKYFWTNLNRDSPTWGHFRDMVERLKKIQTTYRPNRAAYRL
jgi:hypothetical protein